MAAKVQVSLPIAFKDLYTPSRHKAYHGGRGGGKSHGFAEVLVARGYERRDFRWLFAREIQNSLNASVKKLLEDKIKKLGLGPKEEGGNGYYKITDRSITGGDGRTEFLFAGLRSNPDSVKSMEGLDGAWVEEANKVSQRSIDLLTPTVRKENSELWWSWNRTSTKDPVDKMFITDTPPARSIVRRVGWRDNPWFPGVLKEEMEWCKGHDHDKWLHVWEGQPVTMSESRVFRNWRTEDIDHLVPQGCVARIGADWGYAVDPSVVVLCYVFGRTLYIRKELWKLKLDIDDTPAFWAGSDWVNPDRPRWENRHGWEGLTDPFGNHGPLLPHGQVIADSARPEIIAHMKKRGFNVRKSIKGAGSLVEGVEFIKSYDVVIHPDCEHTADEFMHYSYETDPLTEEVLPKLADKKNHVIDATRYALETVRRATKGRIGMIAPQVVALDNT